MSKNILFRADSSSSLGIGHIVRDLTFAKKYPNDYIIFAAQKLDGNINYKIKEHNYHLEILNSNKIDELISLIKKLKIDLLIIDHYDITYKDEKKIKQETNVKLLSFDDTYQRHYCDILLNHNISANKHRYKNLVPQNCQLLCGKKYTLLREDFYKEKKKIYKKDMKNKKKNIFIAMGGADHSQINISILQTIKIFNTKNLTITIVTTSANKNLKNLKNYTKNKLWINLEINSNKIAKLINQSDLCIISPSVIANEVYFLNKPLIAIKTASNQTDIFNYLKKKKYPVLKKFNKKKLKDELCKIL